MSWDLLWLVPAAVTGLAGWIAWELAGDVRVRGDRLTWPSTTEIALLAFAAVCWGAALAFAVKAIT